MPGPVSSSLLFGEGFGAGEIVFTPIAHLDVFGDELFVGDFGVSLDYSELLFVFANGYGGEIAALELCLVESVEEGEGYVLIRLVIELPVDPLWVL